MPTYTLPFILIIIIILWPAVKVIKEYEKGVVFRLGKINNIRQPGVAVLIPYLDKLVRVSTRLVSIEINRQKIFTQDKIPAEIDVFISFKVQDPAKAITALKDIRLTLVNKAIITLRRVCAQTNLQNLVSGQAEFEEIFRQSLESESAGWGISIESAELKNIDLPQSITNIFAARLKAEILGKAEKITEDEPATTLRSLS